MSASVGPKVSASTHSTDDINAVRGQETVYATLDPIHKEKKNPYRRQFKGVCMEMVQNLLE